MLEGILNTLPILKDGGVTIFCIFLFIKIREITTRLNQIQENNKKFGNNFNHELGNHEKRIRSIEYQAVKRWTTFEVPEND